MLAQLPSIDVCSQCPEDMRTSCGPTRCVLQRAADGGGKGLRQVGPRRLQQQGRYGRALARASTVPAAGGDGGHGAAPTGGASSWAAPNQNHHISRFPDWCMDWARAGV